MAYTKTPESSTHQVVRYPVRKSPGDNIGAMANQGEYYLDCLPMVVNHHATDPSRVLVKRPHLATSNTTLHSGTTAFRGVFELNGTVYTAVGGSLYVNGSSAGSLHYSTGAVFMEQYRYGTDNFIIIIEAHSTTAYITTYNLTTTTLGSPVSMGFATSGRFAVLDGYIFVIGAGQRIYNSTLGAPTTFSTSTDFIETEQYGDAALYCFTYRNYLCVVGANSMEFFYDAANENGSPLARQTGYSHRLGFGSMLQFALGTVTKLHVNYDNEVYILLTNTAQQIGLYRLLDFGVTLVQEAVEINNQIASGATYYTTPGGLTLIPIKDKLVIYLQSYHLVYDPSQRATAYWYFKDANGAIEPLLCYSTGTGTIKCVNKRINASSGYDVCTTLMSSTTYSSTTESTFAPEYHTDLIDLGTRNFKHIKWVDVLGVFNDEQIRLYYTSDPYSGTWTDTGFVYGTADYAETVSHRWRNLGRHRQVRFKLVFTGSAEMKYIGLEIATNLGVAE